MAATAEGIKLGCRGIAITSGGRLADLAKKNDFSVYDVPTGLPPRGAFGHLFGILAAISRDWTYPDPRAELDEAVTRLRAIRTQLRPESSMRSNRAKALAVRIRATVPILYAAPPFSAVARRWQTQVNENAKVLAFSSTLPEADHNELVGWVEDPRARSYRPIILRDADEPPELKRQLDITTSLMSKRTKVEEVRDDGPSLLSRMLGTLYLVDYVSPYLAALPALDPLPLKPTETLKAKLAAARRKS